MKRFALVLVLTLGVTQVASAGPICNFFRHRAEARQERLAARGAIQSAPKGSKYKVASTFAVKAPGAFAGGCANGRCAIPAK